MVEKDCGDRWLIGKERANGSWRDREMEKKKEREKCRRREKLVR